MIAYLTLGLQIWILFVTSWICWNAFRTNWTMKQTRDLIAQYRREIEWLTARIETVENGKSSKRAT